MAKRSADLLQVVKARRDNQEFTVEEVDNIGDRVRLKNSDTGRSHWVSKTNIGGNYRQIGGGKPRKPKGHIYPASQREQKRKRERAREAKDQMREKMDRKQARAKGRVIQRGDLVETPDGFDMEVSHLEFRDGVTYVEGTVPYGPFAGQRESHEKGTVRLKVRKADRTGMEDLPSAADDVVLSKVKRIFGV